MSKALESTQPYSDNDPMGTIKWSAPEVILGKKTKN